MSNEKDAQLKVWKSQFGVQYTDRNRVDPTSRQPAWEGVTRGLEISSVLEVGCNRGHNLAILGRIFPAARRAGVEPNDYARSIAETTSEGAEVHPGSAYELPFEDQTFDLVFTACVLIHVPLDRLGEAMEEIHRVSSRYVLAVEYFAEAETVIDYRGNDELLWKRNFRRHYLDRFPDLTEIKSGYLGPEDGFDRCHWWLFSKPV